MARAGATDADGPRKKKRAGAAAVSGDASSTPHEPPSAEALSFEEAMSKLEGVVDRLERGDLELEDALSSFEEGVRLTRRCAEQLDAAERRIEILTREGDALVSRPFADDTGASDADDEDESDDDADEGWED